MSSLIDVLKRKRKDLYKRFDQLASDASLTEKGEIGWEFMGSSLLK